MSQTITFPTYPEISDALLDTGATISPAETHGIMCGMICSSPYENAPSWEKLLVGTKKNAAAKKLLQQLYVSSSALISEFALEFVLLLPEEEIDINERTEQLGLWCQGFLVGLQQGPLHLPGGPNADTEAAEAMHDLAEIAQVSYGEISNSEGEETALFELVEYVRLAVLMLYHEIRTPTPAGSTEKDMPLH
jgi:uncharacterized protein YgfB (UPF0149 family)